MLHSLRAGSSPVSLVPGISSLWATRVRLDIAGNKKLPTVDIRRALKWFGNSGLWRYSTH